MDDVIHLNEPTIRSGTNLWMSHFSSPRKQILLELIKYDKINKYQLGKKLKKHHATVVYDFIEIGLGQGLIESCESRVQERNKNKTTDEYRLTKKGFENLVSYYYDETLKNNSSISELKKIVFNARKNYPKFILDIFLQLPHEYYLIFYPYFEEWKHRAYWKEFFWTPKYEPKLIKYLKILLNHKSNEDQKRIVVNNTFFEQQLTITEKEMKIITEFVDVNTE